MSTIRRAFVAGVAAVVALMLVAGATARAPTSVQTTSYPWVQLPARIGLTVPRMAVVQTSYRWVQPPAWITMR